MNNARSVIFMVPHWNTPGFVGNLRAHRMLRWLTEEKFKITLIRAGLRDRKEPSDFGEIVTIRDPLRMHADIPDKMTDSAIADFREGLNDHDAIKKGHVVQHKRNPNSFRRWLAYVLLIPDPGIVWARKVVRHPLVRNACTESAYFLASSPPESALIAASRLAGQFRGRFIMDMRDGWLDEPIKPLLRTSKLQRWREKRLEQRIIQNAFHVWVTSDHWKSRLINRYPRAESKTTVLTNAYPPDPGSPEKYGDKNIMRFLYAGRMFSSGPGRRIELLLNVMLSFALNQSRKAEIIFLGDLIPEEERILRQWNERFQKAGWEVSRINGKPHQEALKIMKSVDVLLLLSASHSAIPAKFFDYISAGKPIFAAAPADSSVSTIGKKLDQYYGFPLEDSESAYEIFNEMMKDITNNNISISRPEEFEESCLKPKFLSLFQDKT